MEQRLELTSAIFSDDRKYRYALRRFWFSGEGTVMFIGLNPSTADETHDDPTIKRCVSFAMDWGYHFLIMANIFAFRATDPEDMKRQGDPIGPDNDCYLRLLSAIVDRIVVAWGAHGVWKDRELQVRNLLKNYHLCCLGTTKAGNPRHPLYVRSDTKLIRWPE